VNHGNMDGGSFVFELNGVRWSVDPGNQGYNELEKEGFDLWGKCQTCDRWKLLTKNNYGHSTLTVNDSLHRVHGMTSLKEFRGGNNPMSIFEMSETFGDIVASAFRKFSKDSPSSLLIEDEININENTNQITWQLMTTADVEIVEGGA